MATFYVGSYTNEQKGRGIYQLDMTTLEHKCSLLVEADNPTFLAVHQKYLAALTWNQTKCGLLLFDFETKKKNVILRDTIARGACHVAISADGQFVSLSYFHEGSFELYDVDKSERVFYYVVPVNAGQISRIHHTEFIGDYLLVVDYGLDCLYVFDEKRALVQTLELEPGSGPRQLVKQGDTYYLLCENKAIIYHLAFDCSVSILSKHVLKVDGLWSGSAIQMYGERYLLFCSRGMQRVFVYDVLNKFERVTSFKTGKEPRDFCIANHKLFITNQEDDCLSMLTLSETFEVLEQEQIKVYHPSCIKPAMR